MRRKIIALTLVSAFALSACGVKGSLQTAPPVWGDKTKTEAPTKTDPSTP